MINWWLSDIGHGSRNILVFDRCFLLSRLVCSDPIWYPANTIQS